MTNEERDIITQFIARVGGAPIPGQPSFGGSVPATTPPAALPPVDREADGLIAQQFQRYPEARYRITQLAFVQEHALMEAQNRIQRLEWELQQAQQQAAQAQQAAQEAQQQQRGGGGFFGGLFGGGRQSAPPPPPPQGPPGPWGAQRGPQQGYAPQPGYPPQQGYYPPPPPQYAPGYQPGMFQRQGSGFLGSALTTAAGVAGGMLAANAITSMFSGGHGAAGALGGGAAGAAASPWATPAAVDQGSWDTGATGIPDQGYADTGSWDQQQQPAPDSSWDDNSGGGGWDNSGGGGWDTGSSSDDETF